MLKNNHFQWKLQCISLALCLLFSQSSNGLDSHIAKQDNEAATSDKTTETVQATPDAATDDKKHHAPRAVNISKQTIKNHLKAPATDAVICKRRTYTGSRIPKRSCKTVAELNQEIMNQNHSRSGIKPKQIR